MLDYWNRLINLPDKCLAKKALIENVNLRTNWILTIEKLIKTFNLIEVSSSQFKRRAKINISEYYKTTWKNKLTNQNLPRLQVYKLVNSEFTAPKHLGLPYHMRKIRCSNHQLEIEKGRHNKTPREDRICKTCTCGAIEDENHFLLECLAYKPLREMYNMNANNIRDFLGTENQLQLAKYLISSFELRERLAKGRGGSEGGVSFFVFSVCIVCICVIVKRIMLTDNTVIILYGFSLLDNNNNYFFNCTLQLKWN